MDLEILDRKIRRLQCKLKKYNIDLEIFEPGDIEYGAILGKGGEGLVQKCCVTYNGIPVDAAVKTVTVKGDEDDDALNITLDEIELLCLGNDHVLDCTLRVYGVAAIPDENDPELGYLAIITEAGLMNALQLYQEEEIPLHVNLDLWSRIAAAVHCLHNKKIIHHDLKPENILITGIIRNRLGQIEKLQFKIIDLGMGRRLYTKKIVTDDILGTNGYHPPEVLLEDSYDFRADVFMLGVTFCVLLHAKGFLKSGQLQNLLRKMHLQKKRGVAGEQLYAAVLEHHISDTHDEISPLIRSMLCNMLETQEHRDIALERVVDICREESEREKARVQSLPPALTPATSINCQDSGFGSGEGSAGDGNSKRSQRTCTRYVRKKNCTAVKVLRSQHLSGDESSCIQNPHPEECPRRRLRSDTAALVQRPSLDLQSDIIPDETAVVKKVSYRRDCCVCSRSKDGMRRRTTTVCVLCGKGLHAKCSHLHRHLDTGVLLNRRI